MNKEYLELTRIVERLHRRFLDVLRVELNRMGERNVNAVQALLLTNIGTEEIAIRDLIERGYYLGSNVSYNIKKLVEYGLLEQHPSIHDRRSINIRLTPRALDLVERFKELEERQVANLAENDIAAGDIKTVLNSLKRVERTWADYVQFGAA
ncbi:MAG: MarR family transcriptional regulator [Alphaproteobacteria bacterium]|nr:MarR family transcriptional regulator [Rhodospirillales bacterium]MCW9045662.1 MarR family transcriptional regulator [Alphaproteobacteria bacterium]